MRMPTFQDDLVAVLCTPIVTVVSVE